MIVEIDTLQPGEWFRTADTAVIGQVYYITAANDDGEEFACVRYSEDLTLALVSPSLQVERMDLVSVRLQEIGQRLYTTTTEKTHG